MNAKNLNAEHVTWIYIDIPLVQVGLIQNLDSIDLKLVSDQR